MSLLRHPVALGKLIGLCAGLAGFFMLPALLPEASVRLQWGILLWYLTFGAVVGALGTTPQPDFIPLRITWWLRAPLVGAWMNFVLTFFAWDWMKALLIAYFDGSGPLTSPWWFVAEGAIIGLLIGVVAALLGKSRAGQA